MKEQRKQSETSERLRRYEFRYFRSEHLSVLTNFDAVKVEENKWVFKHRFYNTDSNSFVFEVNKELDPKKDTLEVNRVSTYIGSKSTAEDAGGIINVTHYFVGVINDVPVVKFEGGKSWLRIDNNGSFEGDKLYRKFTVGNKT